MLIFLTDSEICLIIFGITIVFQVLQVLNFHRSVQGSFLFALSRLKCAKVNNCRDLLCWNISIWICSFSVY